MTSCPSFGHENNHQVELYFSFLCRVMKVELSTALGLVSRLFSYVHYPLNFKMPDVNCLFLNPPHNQNLKYAHPILFEPKNEIFSQQQENLIQQLSHD